MIKAILIPLAFSFSKVVTESGNRVNTSGDKRITGQHVVSPCYMGVIQADVEYGSGSFSLKNLRFEENPE